MISSLDGIDSIDLALSGGGLRATFFHLGVFGYLYERRLLSRVNVICSVSGGSILAAHATMHWREYTDYSETENFHESALELTKAIGAANVSGEALRRSLPRLLLFWPMDSATLVAAYRHLLTRNATARTTWADIRKRQAASNSSESRVVTKVPDLHILATDIRTNSICSFSSSGFELLAGSRRGGPTADSDFSNVADMARKTSIDSMEVIESVAASSAFPPLFSPIKLPTLPFCDLIDGGVYDNSGATRLVDIYKKQKWTSANNRLALLSDASRIFSIRDYDRATKSWRDYRSISEIARRVLDAQGAHISAAEDDNARRFFEEQDLEHMQVAISEPIEPFDRLPSSHSARVQQSLPTIRTELDRFSPEEILALYRHGFLITQQKFHARFGIERTELPWTPVDEVPVHRSRLFRRDGFQSLKSIDEATLNARLATSDINKQTAALTYAVRFATVMTFLLFITAITAFYVMRASHLPSVSTSPTDPSLPSDLQHIATTNAGPTYDRARQYFYSPSLILESDASRTNYLNNSGFRPDAKGEGVASWEPNKGYCDSISVESAKGLSDGLAVGLQAIGCPGPLRHIYLDQPFSRTRLEQIGALGRTATLRVWARGPVNADAGGPEFLVQEEGALPRDLPDVGGSPRQDADGWELRQLSVVIPPTASLLKVRLNAYGPLETIDPCKSAEIPAVNDVPRRQTPSINTNPHGPIDFGTVNRGDTVIRKILIQNPGPDVLSVQVLYDTTFTNDSQFLPISSNPILVSFSKPQCVAIKFTANYVGPATARVLIQRDGKTEDNPILKATVK